MIFSRPSSDINDHFMYHFILRVELNDKYAAHFGGKYPGYLVVIAQIVNLLLMGDYIYYWGKKFVIFNVQIMKACILIFSSLFIIL
jgi:hypothetical protein